jgi:hypothetical protein
MTRVEAERIKQEVGTLQWPHARHAPRIDYLLTEAQLDFLTYSIQELHRQKRELHDQLHRLRAARPGGREP